VETTKVFGYPYGYPKDVAVKKRSKLPAGGLKAYLFRDQSVGPFDIKVR